jgi:hypothetical protein
VDRLGIYSNLHIVHCGPQGLTYLRDGEPSMSATTAPPDAQLSVKHQVPANLADGLALGLVKILRFFANTFSSLRPSRRDSGEFDEAGSFYCAARHQPRLVRKRWRRALGFVRDAATGA